MDQTAVARDRRQSHEKGPGGQHPADEGENERRNEPVKAASADDQGDPRDLGQQRGREGWAREVERPCQTRRDLRRRPRALAPQESRWRPRRSRGPSVPHRAPDLLAAASQRGSQRRGGSRRARASRRADIERWVFRDTAGIHGDRYEQKPDQRTARRADNDAEALPALNHKAIVRRRHVQATCSVATTHSIAASTMAMPCSVFPPLTPTPGITVAFASERTAPHVGTRARANTRV